MCPRNLLIKVAGLIANISTQLDNDFNCFKDVTLQQERVFARLCNGVVMTGMLNLGCMQGAILRSIQRYGRISRRTNKKQSPEAEVEDRAKDPRFLYLSIDEASTHVGGKRFRQLDILRYRAEH